MKVLTAIALLLLSALTLSATIPEDEPLTGSVKDINGKEVDLASYKGKVLLVVNVASHCGFTKQYKQLQGLHDKYGEKGLVVMGFPCNQFGKQEPGTEAEIKMFCEDTYSVSFPMFSKIDVNGESASSLYKYLTSENLPLEDQGDIKWNFEKFLINKEGKVIARYRSRTSPDDSKVVTAIEAALAE